MTPDQQKSIEATSAERAATLQPTVNHLNVDDLDRRLKLVEAEVFRTKEEPEQTNG